MRTTMMVTALAAALAGCATTSYTTRADAEAALTAAGHFPGRGGEVPDAEADDLRYRFVAVVARYEAQPQQTRTCRADRATDPCYRHEHAAYLATHQFMEVSRSRADYRRAVAAVAAAEAFASRAGF